MRLLSKSCTVEVLAAPRVVTAPTFFPLIHPPELLNQPSMSCPIAVVTLLTPTPPLPAREQQLTMRLEEDAWLAITRKVSVSSFT